jgi:hypothetical protein
MNGNSFENYSSCVSLYEDREGILPGGEGDTCVKIGPDRDRCVNTYIPQETYGKGSFNGILCEWFGTMKDGHCNTSLVPGPPTMYCSLQPCNKLELGRRVVSNGTGRTSGFSVCGALPNEESCNMFYEDGDLGEPHNNCHWNTNNNRCEDGITKYPNKGSSSCAGNKKDGNEYIYCGACPDLIDDGIKFKGCPPDWKLVGTTNCEGESAFGNKRTTTIGLCSNKKNSVIPAAFERVCSKATTDG